MENREPVLGWSRKQVARAVVRMVIRSGSSLDVMCLNHVLIYIQSESLYITSAGFESPSIKREYS